MRRVACLVVMFCCVAMSVAAQKITHVDTLDNNSYAPIDYTAIMRELERASRPTAWQRFTDFFGRKGEPQTDKNFNLSGNVGVGYSQETSAMFVATGTAQYLLRDDAPQSFTSLSGMVSVNGFYRVQLAGALAFSEKDNLEYNIGGGEMPIRFWGLGYDVADNATRSKYTQGSISGDVSYIRHITRGLAVGAGVEAIYLKAYDIEPLAEEYLLMAGASERELFTTGVSLMAEYDSKSYEDNIVRGYYAKVSGSFYPQALGNQAKNMWHAEATFDYYQPLWRGAVAAFDIYAQLWSQDAPWLLWSKIGGDNRMRGYYYGRYIDRDMATAQIELRQTIYGPISGVVWGGAGTIFSSFKHFDIEQLLPNYGLGLRVAAGDKTSLRIDYGFGRHSNGLVVSVNEAF